MCNTYPQFLIEGWIIDPYVQSLFYCSHLVQVLKSQTMLKLLHGYCGHYMLQSGGIQSSLKFIHPKVLEDSSNSIPTITIHPVTLVSVDDCHKLSYPGLDLCLWEVHQEVLDGGAKHNTTHSTPSHHLTLPCQCNIDA